MARRRAEARGAYVTPADRTMASLAPPPHGPAGINFKRPEIIDRLSSGDFAGESRAYYVDLEQLAEALFQRMQGRFVPRPQPGQDLAPRINELLQEINRLRSWAADQSKELQANWQPFLVITELFVRIVQAAISRDIALDWLLPMAVRKNSVNQFRKGLSAGEFQSSNKLLSMAQDNISRLDTASKEPAGDGQLWVGVDQQQDISWGTGRLLNCPQDD